MPPITPVVAICAALSALPAFAQQAASYDSLEALGEALFFDTNLSFNRTQSCATCHSPDVGFIDPRETELGRMVSLGDDGESLGDRNTPTASYAAFSPKFHQTTGGMYKGGQFLDGREADLAGQAGGPPLNPIEMGMPDKASVVDRLEENPAYVASMKALFSDDIFADDAAAYGAMANSIARFEQTKVFAPFDSKYDKFLRGEVMLTGEEELGRLLFFSQQFTNCNICHQLNRSQIAPQETFSNYEFHNIGVPVNSKARAINGVAADFKDLGLGAVVNDPTRNGKFKVPTLRNVAVTGPYMHNGVFEDLRTVVLFYNKYNSKAPDRQINPETGAQWADPEVAETISWPELEIGPSLDDQRVDALVAFMKTLTDARYEHLLED